MSERATLDELVKQLALSPERVAIERNREVVRRADWPQTELSAGDRIEIVHFVGGGEGDGRGVTDEISFARHLSLVPTFNKVNLSSMKRK